MTVFSTDMTRSSGLLRGDAAAADAKHTADSHAAGLAMTAGTELLLRAGHRVAVMCDLIAYVTAQQDARDRGELLAVAAAYLVP